MKVIQPSFELRTSSGILDAAKGIELLRWVEFNARISHRSEDAQTDDSWKRFIQAVVVEHGDYSVTEHATVTAILRVDRGVMCELRTHRIGAALVEGAYTVESTRFVNYGKKDADGNLKKEVEFIRPEFVGDDHVAAAASWRYMMHELELSYLEQLAMGQPPQIARSVLPNATACSMSITYNLRNWRHFFLMRTSKEAHPDFRRTSIPMLKQFQACIPLLFDDIVPMQRQIENMGKPR
jgi:thymidylate synthase (FAD)